MLVFLQIISFSCLETVAAFYKHMVAFNIHKTYIPLHTSNLTLWNHVGHGALLPMVHNQGLRMYPSNPGVAHPQNCRHVLGHASATDKEISDSIHQRIQCGVTTKDRAPCAGSCSRYSLKIPVRTSGSGLNISNFRNRRRRATLLWNINVRYEEYIFQAP